MCNQVVLLLVHNQLYHVSRLLELWDNAYLGVSTKQKKECVA